MGIFNRLNRLVKSNVNALLDQAEDPDKLIDQTVSDLEASMKQARRDLVETLGTAKRLDGDVEKLVEEAQGWEDKAAMALRVGDEALARDALRQKLISDKKLERIREQAAHNHNAAEQMKSALEQVEQKTEDLKARKSTLAAQVRAAREVEAPLEPAHSQAFDDLQRLTGRIDQMEAEVEASAVLTDPNRAQVDAKFRELERNETSQDVEDQLAELKRKVEDG